MDAYFPYRCGIPLLLRIYALRNEFLENISALLVAFELIK